jgi:hypothetical protein
MDKLLDCIKIYDKKTDTLSADLTSEQQVYYDTYVRRIGHDPLYNVWYDTLAPRCIGADDTYENSVIANEASFLTDRASFLTHPRWGVPHALGITQVLNQDAHFKCYDDIFYEDIERVRQYKDSTILIVGGGPTTNLVDWEAYPCDYVWSCNHFFLNPKFKTIVPSLVYLNNEIDCTNVDYQEYLRKTNPLLAIDTSISRPFPHLAEIRSLGLDTLVFNQRSFLTGGSLFRLIMLATYLEASTVAFVGMDGLRREDIESRSHSGHAFQSQKRLKVADNYTFDFQRRETVVYWDYLLNFVHKYTKYQNLGENYKDGVTAQISKSQFPLEKEKQ